jgi:hypothetical protein
VTAALNVSAAAYQTGVNILKLAAAVLAGATAAMAVMNYQDAKPAAVELGRNETIVYRQVPTKSHARLTEGQPAELTANEAMSQNYSRAVQTVRFSNSNPGEVTFTLAAASTESVPAPQPTTGGFKLAAVSTESVPAPRPMTKVGGFIAFPGKEVTDPADVTGGARPNFPRKRPATVMDEVDDYLWEVYQRAPVKRDSSGDFSWKDPAAAKRMGMALQDYVIVGMDPDFREQLYHAGKAMDAAGLQWSMLSAFRDDYRQRLASGFKASGGNSLHGGSARTGGYGHGRAIDITNAEGEASDVWKWIDAHGGKYGLFRPMPGNDPAHIQQKGDWRKIAQTLRANRGVTLVADAGGATSKDVTGSTKETTGRKHRLRYARAR